MEKFVCAHCGNEIEEDDTDMVVITTEDGETLVFCDGTCAENAGFVQCEHCGKWLPIGEAVEVGDYYYCDDNCAGEDDAWVCYNCNTWHSKDDDYIEVDGKRFCDDDCAHECDYYQCEHCGEWFDLSYQGVRTEDDHYYCDSECAENDDYRECDNCGEWHPRCEMYYTVDTERYFCESCSDDLYCCDECGEYYEYDDDIIWDDEGERYLCRNCYDNMDCNGPGIHDYHTMKRRDRYEFHSNEGETRRNNIHMGFELEVDNGEDASDTVEEINDIEAFENFFCFEHDGSLTYRGFEIISNPASINWHVAHRDDYQKMADILKSHKYVSHNSRKNMGGGDVVRGTCGLHIHLDRQYFGGYHEQEAASAKLLYLFEKHWDNMVKFSRRTSSGLHWCDSYKAQVGTRCSLVKIAKKQENYGRYFAVNLTNTNTIEIRLWRGTLNMQTFIATLKFTARLCELVKTKMAAELAKMSFEDLLGDDPDIRAYWATRTTPDAVYESNDTQELIPNT